MNSAIVERALREPPERDANMRWLRPVWCGISAQIRSAAAHESGHLLAELLLGGKVGEARILGRDGRAEADYPVGLSARDEVKVLIAGDLAAQVLWERAFSCGEDDMRRAQPILRALYGAGREIAALDELVDEVSTLLARERRALYNVALVLGQRGERGRISGDEVRRIAKANGAKVA